MFSRFWNATRSYGREYTRFSRNARLFLLSSCLSNFSFTFFVLYFNFYLRSLNFDEGTIGLMNAVPFLAGVLFALPAGYLGDRFSRKKVLIAGLVIDIAGFTGFCLTGYLPLFIFFVFLESFGLVLRMIVSTPFMTDNTQPEDRTQLFSLQFASFTLVNFIGSIGGGFLPGICAGILGVSAFSTQALQMCLLTSVLFMLAALVPLLRLTETPRRSAPVQAVKPPPAKRWLPKQPGLIFWLVFPELIIGLGAGMIMPFLNIFISYKFQVDFEGLGLLFGFAELSTTLAVFIQPVLARRYGKVKSVVIFQALSIPFLLLLGFAPYFWMVAIGLYVRGALMQASNPVYQVFIQEQVREDERATANAALSVADSLSRGTGSIFSGFVRGAVGPGAGFNILFVLMIGFYFSSILIFFFRFRHAERDQALELAAIPTGPGQGDNPVAVPGPDSEALAK